MWAGQACGPQHTHTCQALLLSLQIDLLALGGLQSGYRKLCDTDPSAKCRLASNV
jgi:hypothetical protein